MPKSFSLKTLFGITTLLAVGLKLTPVLHQAYWSNRLVYEVKTHDGCDLTELINYGEQQHFHKSWVDDALKLAAESGDYHSLYSFGYSGFDFDRLINEDQTAVMHAAANGHFNAVKMLLENNANTRLLNRDGKSALDLAREAGYVEIAGLISASQSDSWTKILQVEQLVFQLSRERDWDSSNVSKLLKTEKYSDLASRVTDIPLLSTEEMWFRANAFINIGFYKNGGFTWMVNGKRVSDVWGTEL